MVDSSEARVSHLERDPLNLPRSKTRVVRWLVAVLSVVAATGVVVLSGQVIRPTPNALYFCAVIFSAWLGGFGPGLLASFLSALAVKYFDTPSLHTLLVSPGELPRLLLFLGSGVFISWVCGQQRRADEALRLLSKRLEGRVQERTRELHKLTEELKAEMADRKQAETQLRQIETTLVHATRVTTIGELTASIAHEVNQPLAAVMNNANACLGLLSAGPENSVELSHALTEIVHDVERASAVIERTRSLAKNAAPNFAPQNLHSLVSDVLVLVRHESDARHVTIQIELPDALPLVPGDRVQLQQVMLNLVLNALDAMAEVEAKRRLLVIRGQRGVLERVPVVIISVRDFGVGFQVEDVERLFKPFHTTKVQGLGLGLAICRSIIEAHNGRLWAEPSDGPGATLSFCLPAIA